MTKLMDKFHNEIIGILDDEQKVIIYNLFTLELEDEMRDFGSNSGHPTFYENTFVVMDEFKCLYIDQQFMEDIK